MAARNASRLQRTLTTPNRICLASSTILSLCCLDRLKRQPQRDGRNRQLAGPQNPQNLGHLTPWERIVLSIYFENARRERPRDEKTVSQPGCPRLRVIMDCSPRFWPVLAH